MQLTGTTLLRSSRTEGPNPAAAILRVPVRSGAGVETTQFGNAGKPVWHATERGYVARQTQAAFEASWGFRDGARLNLLVKRDDAARSLAVLPSQQRMPRQHRRRPGSAYGVVPLRGSRPPLGDG